MAFFSSQSSQTSNSSFQSSERFSLKKFLFRDWRMSWLWFLARLYVGWQWFEAGSEKADNPVWVGLKAGGAIVGFVKNALSKTGGDHPDVQVWYAWFLQHAVLPNAAFWSNLVAFGELFVGIALILGAFTGLAAFFGFFMNLNYLMAGTVSTNPILLVLSLLLMLSSRSAGRIGLDRFIMPRLRRDKRQT